MRKTTPPGKVAIFYTTVKIMKAGSRLLEGRLLRSASGIAALGAKRWVAASFPAFVMKIINAVKNRNFTGPL